MLGKSTAFSGDESAAALMERRWAWCIRTRSFWPIGEFAYDTFPNCAATGACIMRATLGMGVPRLARGVILADGSDHGVGLVGCVSPAHGHLPNRAHDELSRRPVWRLARPGLEQLKLERTLIGGASMRVGWIGVGNMGNPMAKHVLEEGHEFTVHDLRKEAAANLLEMGARWATTPAETSEGQDITFTSLPVPRDVQAVCLGDQGIIEGVSPNGVVVDLSTNSLSTVRELHRVFREQSGIEFMDIPVSGGVRGAIERDLCVMAGGDEATYARIKPVLDVMGDKVMYCGPAGNGTICKLCHQLFGSILGHGTAEVLTMGVKAGVSLEILVEAISKSATGKNPPLHGWRTGAAERNFEPDPLTFFLELARKDVRLACEIGREVNVPMEIANIVEQRMIEAMNRGWGRKKAGITRLLQEEKAGVQL